MSERRRNPLTDEWVIVSPGRVARPWQGEAATADEAPPRWSAECHLCPRNRRASGIVNPDYRGTFVFDNDFPALSTAADVASEMPLFRSMSIAGRCRVICYSERHDVTLAMLDDAELVHVIDAWRNEWSLLSPDHAWVQIFENKGRMMGASSEHPHGQVWASTVVPTIPAREEAQQRAYQAAHHARMLVDYARAEVDARERVVVATARWLAVVPYWAAWPFEVMLLPREPCASLDELDDAMALELAHVLGRVLRAYDRIFGVSFPYSMGWHGAPSGADEPGPGDVVGPTTGAAGVPGSAGSGAEGSSDPSPRAAPYAHWQLHAHFYPPLLRSATVRKFMVGFEMLAESQRDLTPESAAQRLRELVG